MVVMVMRMRMRMTAVWHSPAMKSSASAPSVRSPDQLHERTVRCVHAVEMRISRDAVHGLWRDRRRERRTRSDGGERLIRVNGSWRERCALPHRVGFRLVLRGMMLSPDVLVGRNVVRNAAHFEHRLVSASSAFGETLPDVLSTIATADDLARSEPVSLKPSALQFQDELASLRDPYVRRNIYIDRNGVPIRIEPHDVDGHEHAARVDPTFAAREHESLVVVEVWNSDETLRLFRGGIRLPHVDAVTLNGEIHERHSLPSLRSFDNRIAVSCFSAFAFDE